MSFGFIVDTSSKIGAGHWVRCNNISSNIKKKKIFYFSRFPILKNKNNKIKIIKLKKYFDFNDLKKKITYHKIDNLVIDNYDFKINLEKKIRKYVKKIIVIDDHLNKKHYCNTLLNYSFLNSNEKYIIKKNHKKTKLLLGSEYFPAGKDFVNTKSKIKKRKIIKEIFIFFGSGDKTNLSIKILPIIKYFNKIKFHLVIGKLNKNNFKIKKNAKLLKNLKIYEEINSKKISLLIKNSDLAIGSGGVNLFERIYLGLPSIVFKTNKSQNLNIKNSLSENLIINLGNYKKFSKKKLIKTILLLLNDKKKFEKISTRCFNALKLNDHKKTMKEILS